MFRLPFLLLLIASLFVACSNDNTGEHRLTATLTGANEVPGPGDQDGSGSATITLNHDAGTLCYELSASAIEPASAAHIHAAQAGQSGTVVVTLDAPATGQSTGCAPDVTRDLIKRIADKPSAYYVNVHTADLPDGAIRGQLGK
jgi:hypothetical protein